jgi:hypothetical protein
MKKISKLMLGLAFSTFMFSAAASDGNPFAKNQIWKGTYTCAQGDTALILRIKNADIKPHPTDLGDAYRIEAVFDFNFNNRSAAGAFYLSGNYYPESNVATFDPGQWIRRPPGYSAVGMDGKINNDGHSYEGKILFQGCKLFQLQLK